VHIKGKDNVVANALSAINADDSVTKTDMDSDENACLFVYAISKLPRDNCCVLPEGRDSALMAQELTTEQKKRRTFENFPISPNKVLREQNKDKKIQ
jgi:hypothetical protein